MLISTSIFKAYMKRGKLKSTRILVHCFNYLLLSNCKYRSGRMRSRTRSRSRSWERDRRRSRSREHIRRDRERDRSRPWRNESPPMSTRRHDRRYVYFMYLKCLKKVNENFSKRFFSQIPSLIIYFWYFEKKDFTNNCSYFNNSLMLKRYQTVQCLLRYFLVRFLSMSYFHLLRAFKRSLDTFYLLDVLGVAVHHRYDLGYVMVQIIAIIEQGSGTDLQHHFDPDRVQDQWSGRRSIVSKG